MSEFHFYKCDVCEKESKAQKGWMGKGIPYGWITISEAREMSMNSVTTTTQDNHLYGQTCSIECALKYLESRQEKRRAS